MSSANSANSARYAYFPGCSLHSTAIEYDLSTRSLCQKLGIVLEEVEGWICCGASPAHAVSELLAVALPAVSLELARRMGRLSEGGASPEPSVVAVACAACFNRLKIANYALLNNGELREKVKQVAEVDYDGSVPVRHLLDILCHDYLPAIQQQVTKPLKDLKVGCYYGCLLVRPPKIMQFDDPENPQVMDRLLQAVGANVVEFPFKTECCGAALSVPRTDLVHKLVNDILRDAKEAGAEALVVACPLCQINLDLRQKDVEAYYRVEYNMPVFYFTQLLGLALGLREKALGLDKLIVSPQPLLRRKGLL